MNESTIEQVEKLRTWLFELFHSRIPAKHKQSLVLAFGSGCLLHALGHRKAGATVCKRVLNEVVELVAGTKTKCQQIIRHLPGNEETFARATSTPLELNKAFPKQTNEDEL